MSQRDPVKYETLNVRGISARQRQNQLRRLLVNEGVGVLAIQETKLSIDENIAKALEPFLGMHEACASHAVGSSAGCLLFIKKSLPVTELSITIDDNGRFILCDVCSD